jgi:hypothetical protein
MRLLFRCGHVQAVNPDKGGTPHCIQCGESKIARSLDAPLPRIVGHGSGPLVESKALDATPVSLATKHLRLNEPKKAEA